MIQRRSLATLSIVVALLGGCASSSGDFASAIGKGTLHALLFALTAGFLTSLTPCVYPMIPITVGIFGGRAASTRGRALLLATAYVAGIALTFGVLGTTFALLGKLFGTFLANPWVVVPLVLFFFAMAASMFGAFDVALPPAAQERLSRIGGRGLLGAFLMGLVGGLIAAPCTAPPLAGILAYVATTRDAAFGFLLLVTYAAGIGVPFWAIAGFSMQLPKSGPWMSGIKSVFGIALIVAGLYYLRPILPFLSGFSGHRTWVLVAGLAAAATGLALGALSLRHRARKMVGVALVVSGLFSGLDFVLTPRIEVEWLTSAQAAESAARASNKPLLVDFMADWCLPCKEMDVNVFGNPKVAPALNDFVLLRVDLSRDDDRHEAIKTRYHVETLPALRIATADGVILAEINHLVTWRQFLDIATQATTSKPR